MSSIKLWEGPPATSLPTKLKEPAQLVPYAQSLTPKQQMQIVRAFEIAAYDMAAQYAWKRATAKLKDSLGTLGMKFIGEMLGRDDFDESTPIESVVTDYAAIQLAEQLGVIGNTAALKLKQSSELINHYFSRNSDEEIDYSDSFNIVKTSIQFILSEQNISIALRFSEFRKKLLNQTLLNNDPQVIEITGSSVFYLRTILTILLSSIKNSIGVILENSLANINLLLPLIWSRLSESDKYRIGEAYRDVTSEGSDRAASGLKSSLLKVKGFDYVPENLRSNTYKNIATEIIQVHNEFNNFYNEPPLVKKMAKLGSTIPIDAFSECIEAYLAVYLGNRYGVSYAAEPVAYTELSKISKDRWKYFFEKLIQYDEVILLKLTERKIVDRFNYLLTQFNINDFDTLPKENQKLYDAILEQDYALVRKLGEKLYDKMRTND